MQLPDISYIQTVLHFEFSYACLCALEQKVDTKTPPQDMYCPELVQMHCGTRTVNITNVQQQCMSESSPTVSPLLDATTVFWSFCAFQCGLQVRSDHHLALRRWGKQLGGVFCIRMVHQHVRTPLGTVKGHGDGEPVWRNGCLLFVNQISILLKPLA